MCLNYCNNEVDRLNVNIFGGVGGVIPICRLLDFLQLLVKHMKFI